jgi:cysteine desulfurase
MHAMKGVGALIFKDEIFKTIKPLMLGGSQQWGLRPGTLNTEAIYSFGVAAAFEATGKIDTRQMLAHISDIERGLSDISVVNGAGVKRLHNTTNLYFPAVTDVQLFVEKLSAAGVMVSGMSTCDSGISTKSSVLEAMFGSHSERLNGSIRLSVSSKTTRQEISDVIQIIKEVIREA